MSLRRHSSGAGWQLQKLIPKHLRGLFKTKAGKDRVHQNAYLPASVDRGTAKIEHARFEAAWGATFRHLEGLPEGDRAAFIAAGGLDAVRQRVDVLTQSLAAMPTVSDILFSRQPVPVIDAAIAAAGLPRATDLANGTLVRMAVAEQRNAMERELPRLQGLVAKAGNVDVRQIGNDMRDVFDLWVRKKGAKNTADHERTAERWIALNGKQAVREIARAHVESFYAQNKLEMPDKAPAQVAMRNHIRAMLNVAVKAGWIDANPAATVDVDADVLAAAQRGNDDDDDGYPFSPLQLRHILYWAKAARWGGKRHDDYMLALRMLIWTGARSNEVCQLRSTDIATVEGVPCVRFREGEGQSLKNKSSRRDIPLHVHRRR